MKGHNWSGSNQDIKCKNCGEFHHNGMLSKEHSKATRKKMSDKKKLNHPRGMLGKKHTKKSREKMSNSRKGKSPWQYFKDVEQAKKNLSKAKSGVTWEDIMGKEKAEERKRKAGKRLGERNTKKLKRKTLEVIYGETKAKAIHKKLCERSSGERNSMFGKTRQVKSKFYSDLNMWLKSLWEADFARWCLYFNIPFIYEKQCFKLVRSDGTLTTYTPDFFLPNCLVEIKGFWWGDGREKMELFRCQYSNVKLIIIERKVYEQMTKIAEGLQIPNWGMKTV